MKGFPMPGTFTPQHWSETGIVNVASPLAGRIGNYRTRLDMVNIPTVLTFGLVFLCSAVAAAALRAIVRIGALPFHRFNAAGFPIVLQKRTNE
jgi:hypothetical protein